MPKTNQPRRPKVHSGERQPNPSGTNGSSANGQDRRQAQGISAQDAELILSVLRELKKGNFSVRMPLTTNGTYGKIAAEINGIIELNERNAKNLSGVARVIGAVAEGDLFQTMDMELDGRPLEGQFLRTDEHFDAFDLPCQHRAAADDVVADRGGDIGRIGRAAGPAQQCDASDVFDDCVLKPDVPRQLTREPRHARRMVYRLPHAQIAHEGQCTQGVEQLDVIVVHPQGLLSL